MSYNEVIGVRYFSVANSNKINVLFSLICFYSFDIVSILLYKSKNTSAWLSVNIRKVSH
jgi:hypothetical protein